MHLTRIFLLATTHDGAALDPGGLALIESRSLAGVYGTSAACEALPPELAARASVEPALANDSVDVEEFLSAIATQHAGAELLVLGAPELVRSIVATVLGCCAPGRDGAVLDTRLAAVDWPVDSEDEPGERRPLLVGLDLDWIPPAPSQVKTRYPGGPGSAASGR